MPLIYNIFYLHLELTAYFEFNVTTNSDYKAAKYHPLIANLQRSYSSVHLSYLSSSALGIHETSFDLFLSMLADLQLYEKTKKNSFLKSMNIAV